MRPNPKQIYFSARLAAISARLEARSLFISHGLTRNTLSPTRRVASGGVPEQYITWSVGNCLRNWFATSQPLAGPPRRMSLTRSATLSPDCRNSSAASPEENSRTCQPSSVRTSAICMRTTHSSSTTTAKSRLACSFILVLVAGYRHHANNPSVRRRVAAIRIFANIGQLREGKLRRPAAV